MFNITGQSHTFKSAAVVSDWRKNVHWVLVDLLIGLNLPRKSEVKLNDRPCMPIAVFRERYSATQHNNSIITGTLPLTPHSAARIIDH